MKYWLEQLAGELQERLTKEAELVRFDFVSEALGPIAGSVVSANYYFKKYRNLHVSMVVNAG